MWFLSNIMRPIWKSVKRTVQGSISVSFKNTMVVQEPRVCEMWMPTDNKSNDYDNVYVCTIYWYTEIKMNSTLTAVGLIADSL